MTMILCVDFTAFFSWSGWGGIAAIGTLIAASIAVWYTKITRGILKSTGESIEGQRKLAEFEIYMKIAEKIDSDKSQKFIDACINIDLDIEEQSVMVELNGVKILISGTEIRINVLLPFGDLAIFWKSDLISTDTVKNGFGDLLLKVGNSNTIINHIKYLRKEASVSYKTFEELYITIRNTLPEDQKKKYKPDFN